ncbi:MAG TPA: DUF2971 domain-containing protein [Verrucomicrobiales bacterium]|nr:DUF2971 domain-containing protein [Verrucomicrobiales bacterium]
MWTLYKILSPDRLEVLNNLKVRFTQPSCLNDLCDSLPSEEWDENPSDSWIDRAESDSTLSIEAKRAAAREFYRKSYRVGKSDFDSLGVLSLTEKPESLVIWAHYGRNHTGFAIGFDPGHAFLSKQDEDNQILPPLKRVVYTKERPCLPVFDSGESHTRWDYLFHKNAEWTYEGEWRMIKWLTVGKDVIILPATGELVHLIPFPIEAVVEIIVGAHADLRLVKALFHLRQKHGATFEIKQAILSPTTFALDFHTLDRNRLA